MRKTWILAGALMVVAASAMQVSAHGSKGGRGGMGMGRGQGMGMGRGEGMGMVKGTRGGLAIQLGLTADQQTQLDALKAANEEKEKALRDEEQAAFKALLTAEQQAALDAAAPTGRGHRRGAPPVTLTADQQTQFEALRTEYRAKHDALRAEFQTAFEALLSAEQKTKLATLKSAGPFGDCLRPELPPGVSTGTAGTSTSSSAAKVVADEEPAADQAISWGPLKNADSQ